MKLGLGFFFILLSFTAHSQNLDFNRVSAEEEFRTGVTAYHNGLFNRAVIAFERSLNFQPDRILTRQWLGNALYSSGFENSALNEWENVLKLQPSNTALSAWMETVKFRRGVGPLVLPRDKIVPLNEILGIRTSPSGLRFQGPSGLRPLRDGGFLAAVFSSQDILVINLNGNIQRRFPGSVEGFLGPMDILEHNGGFLVSEFRADRIAVVNFLGVRQALIGSRGRGPGQLLGPQFLTMDDRGALYVSEWGNRRVSKFQTGGTNEFLFHIGSGELVRPSGLTIVGSNRDTLVVADKERGSLVYYDLNGNRTGGLSDSRLREAEGLWTAKDGSVYIGAGRRVLILEPSLERLEPLDPGWEQGAKISFAIQDANGHVVVSDMLDNAFRLYAPGSSLYSALGARVLRVSTDKYPQIFIEVAAEDRMGNPLVGLEEKNFFLTESGLPIRQFRMDTVGWSGTKLNVSVVLDRMPWMFQSSNAQDAAGFLRNFVGALRPDGGVWLSEAEESPVQAQQPWTQPGEAAALALNPIRQTERGRVDQALRQAGTVLLNRMGKREVLYVTTGILIRGAFTQYDLLELAQYYQTNMISFHVVQVGNNPIAEELRYLVEKTRGSILPANNADIAGFLSKARQKATPNYILSYTSVTPPENGLRYIPVSVEVNVFRKSGRNELGYFAPLNQRVFN